MSVQVNLPSHPFLRTMLNHITFWDTDAGENPDVWMRLFPNCTTNLSINLHEEVLSMEYGTMGNNMSTSCIRPVSFNTGRRIRMMIVQFKPFAFYLFTGVPMKNLVNAFPDHGTFFSASMLEQVYDQLYTARSNHDRQMIIEKFLLEEWRIRYGDDRMIRLVHMITDQPDLSMDDLSDSANLGHRRLRDLFIQHIGIAPKYFSKLRRFNCAINEVISRKDDSLTAIAVDLGYYDQAHFIRDFREFGGISPGKFRKLQAKTADFYNFNAADPAILV
ncbi:AraC family transcriptional regulator [Fulvivirga sedimenti]|uniref:Helix-turn-helix domain-containing protein n=1 Tax=Fulvivirga sedimenti TaxID=2879465 RepID=A0A9X1HSY8_9BACT|nr:helix-turn-helix domain-containing protein [Fulvivirga sedimenti]MCA6075607.1 helix-turn-helix domain-containing protein [Fulvivirga sedimenti]